MEQITYYATFASLLIIVALWFAFGAAFFLRKRPKSAPDAKREEKSWLGLILQGAGFALVWSLQRRPVFSPVIPDQPAIGLVLDLVAVIFAASSVWLAVSALRELGKQWSLAARLTEDHKLVTTGVYQIVRHPIYTAMLGMMLATGLVLSHWLVVIAATSVFYIGTKIRTTFEERLLGDAFGAEFTEWKARVPGLIPFVGF
jgi:protein-S-isoprenylcysteine O-methyltransferase Ste14